MKLTDLPDASGHFGPYGGVFVAETLMEPIDELRGFDMTPEAAFAKLHYLFAKGADKKAVEAQWQQPLCHELTIID